MKHFLADFENLGLVADRASHILVRHKNRYFRMHKAIYDALAQELEPDPARQSKPVPAIVKDKVRQLLETISRDGPIHRPVRSIASLDVRMITKLMSRATFPIAHLRDEIKALLFVGLLMANVFVALFGWASPLAVGSLNYYAIYVTAGLFLIAVLHELAHAAVAVNFGCNVSRIGIGLYRVLPTFYSDVSDVWRIPARERVSVDAAGIFLQLMLGIVIYLIAIMVTGAAATALRLLFKANLFVVFVNLVPFARLDGYWIVSDLFNVTNLQNDSRTALASLLKRARRANTAVPLNYGLSLYAALNIAFTIGMFGIFAIVLIRAGIALASHDFFNAQAMTRLAAEPLTWMAIAFLVIRGINLLQRALEGRSLIGGSK